MTQVLAQLYDFETQLENGFASALMTDSVFIADQVQILASRSKATTATPRIEVECQLGAASAWSRMVQFAGKPAAKQTPIGFAFAMVFRLVTTRQWSGTSPAIDHGYLRGELRVVLIAPSYPLTSGNLPNLQVLRFLPASSIPNVNNDKDEDISVLTYAGEVQIQDTAWSGQSLI